MNAQDILSLQNGLNASDASYADAICDARILEGLKWEFKRRDSRNGDQVTLSREERKDLAKIISGFANSDGGVFVWGIETEKADGIDRAKCAAPIERVTDVLSSVEAALATLVTPPVSGIECAAWPQIGDRGYLVLRIPRSDRRPHMAIAAGENKYYFRDQEGFKAMLHFQVEDAFARRSKPKFQVTTFVDSAWQGSSLHSSDHGTYVTGAERTVVVALKNISDVTAEHISVEMTFSHDVRTHLLRPATGFRDSHGSKRYRCYHSDGTVHLNPEFECSVAALTTRAGRRSVHDDFKVTFPASNNDPRLDIMMRITARDTRPIEAAVTLDLRCFLEDLPKKAPEPTSIV